MTSRAACAFVVLLAFTYARGLWTGFQDHVCAEECGDSDGPCMPTTPDPACTCAAHVGANITLPATVMVVSIVRMELMTFAEPPRAASDPDPREILHVPLVG